MNYEEKYEQALERAKEMCALPTDKATMEYIFPELTMSEDEKMKDYIKDVIQAAIIPKKENKQKMIAWLEKQKQPKDKGEISDGYHTFNELYHYRMLYNAAFFNLLPKEWVHKSKKHHDGEECFGGGWFIVMANLPTGQISNHYELKDWDLFQIPEKEVADEWDGHTPQDAADRLNKYLLEKQGEPEDKESEDNRIIKNCIHFLELQKKYHAATFEIDECIAWLEKQGGHKGTDNGETEFHVGDLVVINETTYQITEISNSHVVLSFNGRECNFGLNVLDNAHFWTIEDAKDGDVLVDSMLFRGYTM